MLFEKRKYFANQVTEICEINDIVLKKVQTLVRMP